MNKSKDRETHNHAPIIREVPSFGQTGKQVILPRGFLGRWGASSDSEIDGLGGTTRSTRKAVPPALWLQALVMAPREAQTRAGAKRKCADLKLSLPSVPNSRDSGQTAALSPRPETPDCSTPSRDCCCKHLSSSSLEDVLENDPRGANEKLVWPRFQCGRASRWPAAPRQATVFQEQLTPPVTCRTGPTIPRKRTGASALQLPLALTTRDKCPCQPPISHVNLTAIHTKPDLHHVWSIKHGSGPAKNIFLPLSVCGLSSGRWTHGPDALSVRARSRWPSALNPSRDCVGCPEPHLRLDPPDDWSSRAGRPDHLT